MQDVRCQVSPADGLIPLPLAVLEAPWLYMSECTLMVMLAMLISSMPIQLGLTDCSMSLCLSPHTVRCITYWVWAQPCSCVCMMHAH